MREAQRVRAGHEGRQADTTTGCRLRLRQSALRGDLHVYPIGILHVQAGIVALQWSRTTLLQIAYSGFLAETGYPDRKVIHNSGRASMVQRDQHLGVTKANDFARLLLANDGETEHFLIKIDGTLQVRDMNADVVDVRGLEIDVFLGGGGRSARSQDRETSNQFSTAE